MIYNFLFMGSYTIDTFLDGRIRVRQDRAGYRFSIDSVLLAHHVLPRPGDRVLDLGTGCGIVALSLAYRHRQIRLFGVEVQKDLAEIAELNVRENRMGDRITIIERDMRQLCPDEIGGLVDWVVSNPPYRRARSGRINPHGQRAVARHEIMATLDDLTQAARRMLCPKGMLVVIYPAWRLAELLGGMHTCGIEPKSLRTIHSRPDTDAKLVLVSGVRGGRCGITIAPPLVIYRSDGTYTDEVQAMFTA